MARKIKKSKSEKLKRLSIDCSLWDGYRGNKNIAWRLKFGPVEEFATVCKCGEWFGWSIDIYRIKSLRAKMAREGCAKCKGRRRR